MESTLTVTEAAQRLGIRIDTLYQLLRAGRIATIKQDGQWRINAVAVEERYARLHSLKSFGSQEVVQPSAYKKWAPISPTIGARLGGENNENRNLQYESPTN